MCVSFVVYWKILPVFRLCFPADTATQSTGLCFFTAMERKVHTEERTRREGEKSNPLWKMTLQKTEKDFLQTKHFQQNLSATLALFSLCLATRKHKLWFETRGLEQKTKLRTVFLQLRSYSQYKQEFQRAKSPFARLKPIYSDLAQTFLVIHFQFVSISPISMFHLAPLAPGCFLITCNPYQSSPSLLILFPSGYLLPLFMFFYLTELIFCSHL